MLPPAQNWCICTQTLVIFSTCGNRNILRWSAHIWFCTGTNTTSTLPDLKYAAMTFPMTLNLYHDNKFLMTCSLTSFQISAIRSQTQFTITITCNGSTWSNVGSQPKLTQTSPKLEITILVNFPTLVGSFQDQCCDSRMHPKVEETHSFPTKRFALLHLFSWSLSSLWMAELNLNMIFRSYLLDHI